MNGVRPSAAIGSQIEVAILADDLTGAADCAAAFAAAGRSPVVLLEPSGSRGGAPGGGDIVALSANSRDVDDAQARDAMASAVRELSHAQPRIWFKKIDSTLRGHLCPELRVVTEFLRPELTIVCPAFPRAGRVLREGRVYVHGRPLEQTQLWQAAGGGPTHLPAMLSTDVAPVVSVGLAALRDRSLAGTLRVTARGATIVADAERDDDLDALIAAGVESGRDVLWVGSAGLAGALACALQAPALPAAAQTASREPSRDAPVGGPVLVVAGSGAPQTRRQIADLLASRDTELVVLPVAALLDGEPEIRRATGALVERALAAGRDAVVTIEPIGTGSRSGEDRHLSDRLGALVGDLAADFAGLVLTGGDTARAVLQAMGIAELSVLGSVEDGVPLSLATATGRYVVTKAGAFGDDRSLTRAVRLLHRDEVGTTTGPMEEL